uniref:Uncharacterized protein n=1 Tax=Glossina pallidipes TaxID=7398 RepID=A0A1A9ZR40_GLOPL
MEIRDEVRRHDESDSDDSFHNSNDLSERGIVPTDELRMPTRKRNPVQKHRYATYVNYEDEDEPKSIRDKLNLYGEKQVHQSLLNTTSAMRYMHRLWALLVPTDDLMADVMAESLPSETLKVWGIIRSVAI